MFCTDRCQALKDAGNAALAAGDVARATHMFSLGIDVVLGRGAEGKDAATLTVRTMLASRLRRAVPVT